MTAANSPLLSLIAPMYNESAGLELFFGKVLPILERITEAWEIVCVNDGSADDTLHKLKVYAAREPRVRIISLSRNFGKEAALTAGLDHALGQAVIPIDADLQDPPEVIPELVAKWREGYKVVLATRRTRAGDSWMKKRTALAFYRFINHVSATAIPENTGDFRLMDRSVVEVVKRLPERTRFMKGLFAWVGFSTAQIYFDREARAAGQAKQNYVRLFRLAKDGIFSFTTLPLRLTTYLGGMISLAAFFYAAFLIIRTVFFGVDVPGYASIMVVLLLLGGIQLLSIGIIGEYVGRVYREVKHRPLYVVEEKIG